MWENSDVLHLIRGKRDKFTSEGSQVVPARLSGKDRFNRM